ncbi:HVA22-like protein [Vigna angularis]|uniref:HVA22-like protein n=1 Tax=Phaseolus angularis TaxID=3914 RepID=A0A8T0K0C0_PHAAN|nr:HVA22-like protein [Vigna angularis]
MIGSFLTWALAMVFGYAYPAYECYKAVEKNKPEIEQLRFWCQYWILVAVLTQRPGVKVRQPAPPNHQPAAATEPQVEEPPSPTSSTSSSQLQKEVAEELDSPKVPKAATSATGLSTQKSGGAGLSTQKSGGTGLSTQKSAGAALSTQKSAGAALSTQKSNVAPETSIQSAPAESDAKQVEAGAPSSSSSVNENGNPPTPTKETIMEESIRLTRGRLRKTRSAGTR